MEHDLMITMTGVVCFVLLSASLIVLAGGRRHRRGGLMQALMRKAAPVVAVLTRQGASERQATRRGQIIRVRDRAVAQRALVQHSAAFLERPTSIAPSTILTSNYNIISSAYGPYWRAARRNLVAGVLHPSRFPLFRGTRARVLGDLVRVLRSGAPARQSFYFAAYSLAAEMCFGRDVVEKLGETRLRAMEKLQADLLVALSTSKAFMKYPWIARLLYLSRWRDLLSVRWRQDETFLPLVAEVKNNRKDSGDEASKSYVESLLDLRIPEDGGHARAVTDGELVSLISEFLGASTDSISTVLEWTMANLVRNRELQRKLHAEVDAVAEADGDRAIIEEAELSHMPYVKAVVLESLRRHPPAPFVLRHVDAGEDAARILGMPRLPDGGATVNFLVGKIGRDPAAWSDPMAFIPERFMPGGEGEGVDLTCTRELKMMPFGTGRRVCPALAPAMLTLQYFVANLVKDFEWRVADGVTVDLEESHVLPSTTMKHPLRVRLVPRDAAAAEAA